MLPITVPAVLAALYGWAVFASTFRHPGSIGLNYIAPGSDWMIIYGALRLAVSGHFALMLDMDGFTSYINTTFAHWLPQTITYRPWVYPPGFLVLLLPFLPLGFMGSYMAFQVVGAAVLATALLYRPDSRSNARFIALAALTCPAASVNVVDGQCSFLVVGFLVLGFRLLEGRALLAGLVFGLLSFKPQFALMVPVALLALRQWRAMIGAILSASTLAVASAAMFGPQLWLWWLDRAAFSYRNSGSQWASIERLWGNSVYACAALMHATPTLALALQICAIGLAASFTYTAYRSRLSDDVRLAVLLAATLLAAPHFSTYDTVLLAVAGLLWFADLPAPTMKQATLLLLLWVVTFLGPPQLVPIGRAEPLLIAGFIAVALRQPARAAFRPAAALA